MSASSHLEERAVHSLHKRHGTMQKQALVPRQQQCADSGDLYVLPAAGANINSAKQTTISWNSACLNSTSQIDIYLYAPLQPSANLPIHAWTHVPASVGSYDVKLAPKWWNASASVELSLNIVPSGNQPWDSSFSYGPAWYATYTAPTDGSAPPADAVVGSSDSNTLISVFYKGGHLTKGGMAAAIVVPLIVLFIALGIWIRKLHISRNNKLADWAEHMDKRMSKISLDWTSGGDGSMGPTPGSRPASFMQRPQSTYRPSVEAVRAAYAANMAASTEGGHSNYEDAGDAQHRVRESQYSARRSNYRVSFAPSSNEATAHRARNSSLSHIRPTRNMPKVNTNSQLGESHSNHQFDNSEDADFAMSPTQNRGATPVSVDALRRSMDENARRSMLEYPALSMVDAGEDFEQAHKATAEVKDEKLEQRLAPEPLPSPSVSTHTGMLPPSNVESPDEALKQYAAYRAAGGPTPSPQPMRNLYGASPTPQLQSSRASASSYGDEDVLDTVRTS